MDSISPQNPIAGSSDRELTVNGSNYQHGLTATVTFPNGQTATLSGTQIQNVTPTSFTMRITLGNPGTWSLRVNNPDRGQSNVFPFTVQPNIQTPTVFSIYPTIPVSAPSDQDIVVSGANFRPGLTVDVSFPDGGGTTLSGSQIQNVTETSFIMRATLNAPGAWSIKVKNTDNQVSAPFPFNVSSGENNPFITSVTSPLTANGADQNVIVTGGNFLNGLRVNATFPNGGISTLQGTGQIQNVTANSFIMRITLNAEGPWKIRVVNPDNSQSPQFPFNVNGGPPPTGLPTYVLSPVIGPLRVIPPGEHANDGVWEFDQHGTGNHTPTAGISLSNDSKAWDVNLYTPTSGNADAGKAVFATASGQVVSFVGRPPGGGPGAVLIAHPNAVSPVWFSGYLHMNNVRATINQIVDTNTVIGEIGRIGADNDHLHFAVYSGQNTRGNLQSFNTVITERPIGTINQPTITAIEPNTVNQASDPRPITITGTNFQANSILEVQGPNGNYFTVTPETVSGFDLGSKIEKIAATTITARIAFAAGGTYQFTVVNRPTSPSVNSEVV